MIVGIEKEKRVLNDLVNSKRPEFLAVYGRRRVGKTHLIKEYFGNYFSFYAIPKILKKRKQPFEGLLKKRKQVS